MGKAVTEEEFMKRARATWGERWDYSKTNYKKMAEKILVTCRDHGDFLTSPANHVNGRVGCIFCNGQKPLDKDEYVRRMTEKGYARKLDFSKVIFGKGGAHQHITLICTDHNREFSVSAWATIRGGKHCPDCNKNAPHTTEKVLRKAKIAHPNKEYDYSLLPNPASITGRVTIGCPVVGHGFFTQMLGNHFAGKEGCKKCEALMRLMDIPTFIEKSQATWGADKYDYNCVKLERGGTGAVTLSCPTHGEFTYSVFQHLQGNEGCQACRKSFGPSRGELELGDFIESLGVAIERGNRTVLSGKEIDVFCPEQNVGFEFNGLYWHSQRYLAKDFHYNKYKLAQEVGVKLLQIWEDDWALRQEAVKRHIRHKLGLGQDERIYARKTEHKAVAKAEAQQFLEQQHIQGFVSSSYYEGLYCGDKLVALASFLRSGATVTLTRYATSAHVIGGHSKLVRGFEKAHAGTYEELVTFADLTFSDGELCERTGWKLDKLLKPDYSYLVGNERVHKFNFRLRRFQESPDLLYKEGLTEAELAEINGLDRIYDAGKLRFVRQG